MTTAALVLYILVALVYLAATVHYAVEFVRGIGRIVLWDRLERALTLTLHTLFLIALGLAYHELPLVEYSFFSFTAFAVALVHTMIEGRFRTRGTGVFFFALALALHLLCLPGVLHQPKPNPLLQSQIFGGHALTALLGYVGFLISALYGLFYLTVYRSLKSRRVGLFASRMPPLDLLWKMNISAATVGFVFLTVALVLGFALSIHLHAPFWNDPKILQSLFVWLLYGVLILGHYAMGWSGRTLVGLSLACFALLLISSALVAQFFHTFHSFS